MPEQNDAVRAEGAPRLQRDFADEVGGFGAAQAHVTRQRWRRSSSPRGCCAAARTARGRRGGASPGRGKTAEKRARRKQLGREGDNPADSAPRAATAAGLHLHVAPRLAHHPSRRPLHFLAARSLDQQRDFCGACVERAQISATMQPRTSSRARLAPLPRAMQPPRDPEWSARAAKSAAAAAQRPISRPGHNMLPAACAAAGLAARSARQGRVSAPSAAAACVRVARRATGRLAARAETRDEPATARRAASSSAQCARGLHGAPTVAIAHFPTAFAAAASRGTVEQTALPCSRATGAAGARRRGARAGSTRSDACRSHGGCSARGSAKNACADRVNATRARAPRLLSLRRRCSTVAACCTRRVQLQPLPRLLYLHL